MLHLRSNILLPVIAILLFCLPTHAQKKPTIHPLGSFSLDSSTTWLENAFNIPDNITIIGLGEVTHGSHEIPQVKAKLFQYFVEKKGFRTLLFEYPNAALALVNLYLQDNRATSDNILKEIAIYQFSNALFDTALLDLLTWIKHYNLAHPNDMITLKGIDINGASGSFTNYFRHNFDALLDSTTRKKLEHETSIDSITNTLIEWQDHHKDIVQARLKGYYADFLYNVKNAAMDISNRKLEKTDFYRSLYRRDSMMAKNVEELNPGKAIFWAHNSHVASGGVVSAGNILKQDLNDRYYVIATDFSEQAEVYTMSDSGIVKKTFYPDKKALSHLLFQKTKEGIVFYDDLPKPRRARPLVTSINAYGVQQVFGNGRTFDALIVLKTISPTRKP